MRRICEVTGDSFHISSEEIEYCEKHGLPLPGICPREQLRSLMLFRNRFHLYHGRCWATGRDMLTCIPPVRGLRVCDVDYWNSDAWDGLDYGRDLDFALPFFPQLFSLYREVPLPNLSVLPATMENSDYTNGVLNTKNCYLLFASVGVENGRYSASVLNSRDIVDSLYIRGSEICYECFNLENCYNVKFCSNCENCSDSWFLEDCLGCKECFGCVNLRHAEHCFNNEPLSREEYRARVAALELGRRSSLQRQQAEFEKFRDGHPRNRVQQTNTEDSTGNYLHNTKRCTDCFFVSESENIVNGFFLDKSRDSFHTAFSVGGELLYAASSSVGSYDVRFSLEFWPSGTDLEYCIYVTNGSAHCFGCVGLKRKSYCILNKQYSKDEYFDLLGRVRAHMKEGSEYGRQFPAIYSPFFYNRSDAHLVFPLSEEEALARGYSWEDEAALEKFPSGTVPDSILDADEAITGTIFACELSGKKFRFTRADLLFHKQYGLPLPAIAPFERIRLRCAQLQKKPLRSARCSSCGSEVVTSYAEGQRPIYCGSCFDTLG